MSDDERVEEDEHSSQQEEPTSLFGRLRSPKRRKKKRAKKKRPQNNNESEEDDEHDNQQDDDDLEAGKGAGPSENVKTMAEEGPVIHGPRPLTLPQSPFAAKHRVLLLLSSLQVLTWVLGAEFLCLFADACAIYARPHKDHTGLSSANPGAPRNGTVALLCAGLINTAIFTPLGLYLTSTELRANLRAWAALALGNAAGLFGMSFVFFSQAGSATTEVRWEHNPGAQRAYESRDAALAVSAAANSGFAITFLVAAALMTASGVFSALISRSMPRRLARGPAFTLLPTTEEAHRSRPGRSVASSGSSVSLASAAEGKPSKRARGKGKLAGRSSLRTAKEEESDLDDDL